MLDEELDYELTKQSVPEEESAYNKLPCKYSFYIFSKKNPFRILCRIIITHKLFEAVILTLISCAALTLAIETYYIINPVPEATTAFYWINIFLTIVFSIECLMKSICYGFLFEPKSYLRDHWNQLDFFIVVVSILDLSLSYFNIPMIKVLRLLRVFRSLRFVTHNANMKVLVAALLRSFGPLCSTLVMVMVIWLIFSIVGVFFFAGKFQYCSINTYTTPTPDLCIANNGSWRTYDHNFDNSVNGLIYLFELTTQENWPNTFLQATDCTDVGLVKNIFCKFYRVHQRMLHGIMLIITLYFWLYLLCFCSTFLLVLCL